MLSGGACGSTVGPSEHNWHCDISAGHVVLFGGGVHNLIDGLHGKVHSHELNNGAEALICGSGGDAGETHLCDGGVNDSFVAILLVKAFSNLVCSLVLGNLLA